jgi:hypothetical protein
MGSLEEIRPLRVLTPMMSEIAILQQSFFDAGQNHRGCHSTPFADTASMNSRESSSPASFHSKIRYRRPQFRLFVQGARLGSSFHGINALRSSSDTASALVRNFPSCSAQCASSSITNIHLTIPSETGFLCRGILSAIAMFRQLRPLGGYALRQKPCKTSTTLA